MSMSLDDLSRILVASAGETSCGPITELDLDTEFEHLGYDSLALIETAAMIGREFGVDVPDCEVPDLRTPRAVLDRVQTLTAARLGVHMGRHPAVRHVTTETYCELRAFYADHLGVRDQGDTGAWLDAFEEDATLSANSFSDMSVKDKQTFTPEMYALDRRFIDAGLQRRHVVSNFLFTQNEDSTVSSRSYGILVTTSPDGVSEVFCAAVATDVLTRTADGWRVKSRKVIRDDLAQRRTE